MTLKETLSELKAAGTAQNRKIYGRHGVTREMFGVSYAVLGKLTKKIKTDHELALGLWKSGIHDAMVLATMIADPAKLKTTVANKWVKEVDSYPLLDGFCKVIAQTSFAMERAEAWMKSKDEWTGNGGWGVLSHLAPTMSNAVLAKHITAIEKKIHAAPNRTRYTMNGCLISIGIQNAAIQKKAIAAAKRIGKVEVDHGQTSCKTPDAASYIAKTFAHMQKKAAKKAAKKQASKSNLASKKTTKSKKAKSNSKKAKSKKANSKKVKSKKAKMKKAQLKKGDSKTVEAVKKKKTAKLQKKKSKKLRKARPRLITRSRSRTPSQNTNAILTMINNIPPGQVASYGQIARLAGVPRNARQVVAILRSLPPRSGVPWHRVVNSQGKISERKTPDCKSRQRILLENEGVELNERNKVSLSEYGWNE